MTLAAIALAAILPAWEMVIVNRTASECGLTRHETRLLCAIRRAENGTPPYYFGVADRRANTYARQARWAANTIRLRYRPNGDLDAFAARWCPFNYEVWLRNVRFFIRKQEREDAR